MHGSASTELFFVSTFAAVLVRKSVVQGKTWAGALKQANWFIIYLLLLQLDLCQDKLAETSTFQQYNQQPVCRALESKVSAVRPRVTTSYMLIQIMIPAPSWPSHERTEWARRERPEEL